MTQTQLNRKPLRTVWCQACLGLLVVALALGALKQANAMTMQPAEVADSTSAQGAPDSTPSLNPNAVPITEKATLIFDGELDIVSAVIDPTKGFAYFGTNTTPGTIVKVSLPDFKRVDVLTLTAGEDKLTSAVIDTGKGFAYFGTNTSPGRVVKVRLSDFTRVDANTLDSGEDNLTSAVIDAAKGFAYFGTDTAPGIVVKVRLLDLARVAAVPLNSGEDSLSSAVIDTTKGFAYFGTNTAPGIVVKVNVSSPAFARIAAVTLNDGTDGNQSENRLSAAVIDPAKEYAYFGTDSSSGLVVRVRIEAGNFQRSAVVNTQSGKIRSAVIDPAKNVAYFGAERDGLNSLAVKVNLLDFQNSTQIDLNTSDGVRAAVIDPTKNFVYFGTSGSEPSKVLKVNVDPANFAYVGEVKLNVAAFNFWAAVIDPAAGFAYFGTYTDPGVIAKVRLSNFSRVATLSLDFGEEGIRSAVIDTANGFAYFGTNTSPGKVVKVKLADFSRVGAITLAQGEDDLTSAVIDTTKGFAYFGTDTDPGIVVKVKLSDFTRVGAVTLDAGEGGLTSGVIDPAKGFAYFGTNTAPGIVVKVNVNSPTFARVGAAQIPDTGDNLNFFTSAVIDTAKGRAYFGTNTFPGKVVQVDVNPNNAFARLNTAPLTVNRLASAVIDPSADNGAGAAYFGSQEQPGSVVKVSLSPFQQVGDALSLNNGENYLTAAVIDTAKGCAYFGAGDDEAGNFGSGYNPPTSSNRVMKIKVGACKDGSTTALTSAPDPSILNQQVVFTAKVTAGTGTPTGNVLFSEAGVTLDTRPLVNGSVAFSTDELTAGDHTIVATYSGDDNFSSSSGPTTHTVTDNRAATTTALTSAPNPSALGQSVGFTATVTTASGTPSGNVIFQDGNIVLGPLPLVAGIAKFSTSSLAVGAHVFKAYYEGNATLGVSDSNEVTQVVKAASSTTLTSAPDPATLGQQVVFTATVTGSSTPTGTVTFLEPTFALGAVQLSGGVARFTTSNLPAGAHVITARYEGNTTFDSSISAPVTQGIVTAEVEKKVYLPLISR